MTNPTPPTLDHGLELADFLRGRCCGAAGLLGASVDVSTGRLVEPSPIPDELGDYAPYVDRLGERTGTDWCRPWALDQARRAIAFSEISPGWARCRVERRWLEWAPRVKWISLIGAGDFYLGLSAMFERTGAPWLLQAFDRFLVRILEDACREGAPVYGVFVRNGRPLAAVPMTEPMTAAYLTDAAVGFYRGSAQPRFLDAASHFVAGWPASATFRARHLFSRVWHGPSWARRIVDWQFLARERPPLDATIFVKGDAMLVMCMLALRRQRPEPWIEATCRSWADSALAKAAQNDGSFRNTWYPGAPARETPVLGDNHSMLECLIDLFWDLGLKPCLEHACRCAEFWISQKDPVGLIPARAGGRTAALDPQVDFVIQLYRLGQATGDARWTTEASVLLDAVWTRHRVGRALCQAVDLGSGAPTSTVVETKFLGLFLKAVLTKDAVERGQTLLNDESLRALAADR